VAALGWHEFRDPNEEWELTLYRYNANVVRQLNLNIEAARQSKGVRQWSRTGSTSWPGTSCVDARRPRLGLYLFANANRRPDEHAQQRDLGEQHAPDRSAQDLAALYNLTLSEEIDGFDGTAHIETWNSDPAWQESTRPPSKLTGISTGARRLSRQRRLRNRWSGSCSAATRPAGGADHGDFVTPTVIGAEEYDYAERDLALYEGDVHPLDQRQGVRRSQHGDPAIVADHWCLGASRRRASCSRCGSQSDASTCASGRSRPGQEPLRRNPVRPESGYRRS